MPRALCWSWKGVAVSYERGTPVGSNAPRRARPGLGPPRGRRLPRWARGRARLGIKDPATYPLSGHAVKFAGREVL
eukprot:CAMPEP_0180145232 /NCGR_PEP_ID=MMETSP0986-20121125/17521_1 /TAXON_ID=697907 /ORGANISM="non described non described, Strain CCMP2293" /LENGTH=75 /DNA_ID=CAMNT_0022089517 /DNA_START=28 /DNA_END=251 /DNA_ORIENTATION=-